MPVDPPDPLAPLRARFHARAAGWWRVEGDRLVLVAFSAADDLPEEVARGFVAATRSVPMTETDLGIVGAVRLGAPAVSRARDLPPDAGSGLWLRRFAAGRSVAVPIRDDSGRVVRVVSLALALADGPPDDAAVAEAVRTAAATWVDAGPGPGPNPE